MWGGGSEGGGGRVIARSLRFVYVRAYVAFSGCCFQCPCLVHIKLLGYGLFPISFALEINAFHPASLLSRHPFAMGNKMKQKSCNTRYQTHIKGVYVQKS